jgi:hypothetical protein
MKRITTLCRSLSLLLTFFTAVSTFAQSVIINGATNVCAGTPVTFTANLVDATPLTYQWQKGGANIAGATNNTYTVSNLSHGNVITCEMTGVGLNAPLLSNPLTVSVETTPTLTLTPNPVCVGNPITGTMSHGQIKSFDWKRNGASVYAKADTIAWKTVAGGGSRGSGPAQLLLVNAGGTQSGIFVDNNGTVYVADRFNNRIQKWAAGATTGVTVAGGNGQGGALNQLSEPMSVFVDNVGAMYIADRANHRVQKWNAGAITGTTVAGTSGINGNSPSQLGQPVAVVVDNSGNIYIVDKATFSHRVQKWAPGASSGVTVAGITNAPGSTADKLNNPIALAIDAQNNLYVVDQDNHRIQKWATGATVGVTVAGTGSVGAGANELSSPTGVYVDENQNIYVGDDGNARVQRFNYGSTIGVTVAQLDATQPLGSRVTGLWVYKNQIYVTEPWQNRVKAYQFPTSASYTPLAAGNYTVSVTTVAGCNATSNAVSALQVVTTITGTTACVGGNGTVTGAASGGTAPYQYSLDGVNYQSTATFSVPMGTYQITAKDANGCMGQSSSFTVAQTALAIGTPIMGTILCNGGSTSVNVTANNGTAPYQYSWDGGAFSATNTFGANAATHTIRAKDANGCIATSTVTLTEPTPMVVPALTVGNILCNGGSTTLSTTASGGTAGYMYSIGGGLFQASNSFTRPAGTYTILARDGNGCTQSSNTVTLTQPTVLTISAATNAPIPANGTTALTATAMGGTPSYQYSLNAGTYQASSTFTVAAGTHTITVKDANGCTQTTGNIVIANLSIAANKMLTCVGGAVIFTATPVNGGATPVYQWKRNNFNVGTNSPTYTDATLSSMDVISCEMRTNFVTVISNPISVMVETVPTVTVAPMMACMGTAITATLSNGTFASAIWKNNGTVITGAAATTYTTAAVGAHTATITTTAGCVATSAASTVYQVQVAFVGTKTPCNGGIAAVVASASGGIAPYQYSLDGTNFRPEGIFTLMAGNYTITTKDASGCTKVSPLVVTEPEIVRVADPVAWPIACFGGTTVMSASARGGASAYEYSLNGGPFQNTINFTVPAGTYQVTVRDTNGCVGVSNSTILTQPADLVPTSTQAAIACLSGSTTVNMSVVGGTAPFLYSFNGGAFGNNKTFTNIAAGTYTLSVIDSNLCTKTANLVISQPTAVTGTVKVDTIICRNSNTTLVATGKGGTGAYSYSFNGGGFQSGNSLVVLPGTYTIAVSDANNCIKTLPPVTVRAASSLIGTTTFIPLNCHEGLLQCSPNPASSFVTIDFKIPSQSFVMLKVYDMMGRVIKSFDQGMLKGGAYTSRWDIDGFLEGTVLICLEVDGECMRTKKVVIQKQ